jgi:protein-disulfide isomerase
LNRRVCGSFREGFWGRCAKWAKAGFTLVALLILGMGIAPAAVAQATVVPAKVSTPTKTAKPAKTAAPKPRAAVAAVAPNKTYGVSTAPIKMELFTDYQCPTCGVFYEGTLRNMISDYVALGKVYVIHHDFPLPMHKYSGQAARWANAAARVGQFQAVEGALYDNQAAWSADGNIEKFISAAMSSADFARVQKLMAGCDQPGPTAVQTGGFGLAPGAKVCPLDADIEQDIVLGLKVPVTGTPTFVITAKGRHIPATSGNVSWPILKQFFDSLLAQ